jgi:DNA-binding LytR/AlgR family response regulator
MEMNNETTENTAAAILAGLSENDRETIDFLLKNIDHVIFIGGDKHKKTFYYDNAEPVSIYITFTDLDILLPAGKLDDVHESYRINFEKVKYSRRQGRDIFAMMINDKQVPIRRPYVDLFRMRCILSGKWRGRK